jgi:hypothetical protein
VEGDVVEGRISRVDLRTRAITLDNGREYLIPPSMALNLALVPEGAAVKIRYGVNGGRNLVTHIEVRP